MYKLLYHKYQHYQLLKLAVQTLHTNPHLVVILDVDDSLLPLASRHPTVEQDVNLTVRPALHLRQEEEGHDETEETGATPHVAALAAKVCAL